MSILCSACSYLAIYEIRCGTGITLIDDFTSNALRNSHEIQLTQRGNVSQKLQNKLGKISTSGFTLTAPPAIAFIKARHIPARHFA